MITESEFCEFINKLINSNEKIEKIKKSIIFKNIPEEYWKNFETKKIIFRINQEFVKKSIEKDGIVKGIHCQATGCGKSYIILMYCNYFLKNKIKGNIIIFTERVSILEDFFELNNEKKHIENKIFWKNNNLINLDEFEIINRVTNDNKKKDWHNNLKSKSNKTKILLINRTFLTLGKLYEDLTKEHVGMIIHDECHNTPSDMCYNMLTHFNNLNVPIIGFSATPLRTGKTSNEFNKDRLLNIYGVDGELKILSNFNMMYAIKHNLILPPNFVWYEMPSFKTDKNGNLKEKIDRRHVSTVFNVLDKVIPDLPNKKIIAWCKTIPMTNKWYKIFNENRGFSNIFGNFEFCIDHSQIKKEDNLNNYDKFKGLEGNSILFCADKHREGSDIKNLDCCIFIDFVKDRGCIPFIQSIGRVLRKDNNKDKTQGVVIDSFISNSENYDKELVEKIFGYYISFENLSDNDFASSKYQKYIELKNTTEFDVVNKKIQFKLGGNNVINIDCKHLQWNDIESKFEPLLQDKIKLSAYDNFKSKSKILKDKFGFNKNTDFINEYKNISQKDKTKYNLPNIEDEEYITLFNKYSWFELLDIEHDFIELKDLLEQLKDKKINQEIWNGLCEKYDFIPKFPKHVYKNFTFKMFKKNTIDEL